MKTPDLSYVLCLTTKEKLMLQGTGLQKRYAEIKAIFPNAKIVQVDIEEERGE